MTLIRECTLTNGADLEVTLLNYGARIQSLKFAGQEIALSYPKLVDYLSDEIYLGATVGPIANRIAKGQLSIADTTYSLPKNEANNCLHSGGLGVDKWFWTVESQSDRQLCLSLSFDMEDVGMAGQLDCTAEYRIEDNQLVLDYAASCSQDSYLNFTNHVYLNLAGSGDISQHQFTLFAADQLAVDASGIPNGDRREFTQAVDFDLQHPDFGGFLDHHFHANKKTSDGLFHYVHAQLNNSDLGLDILGSSPGFQFYTGKYLSAPFVPSNGFCVEPQYAPNAINDPSLEGPVVAAGKTFKQRIVWRFSKQQNT